MEQPERKLEAIPAEAFADLEPRIDAEFEEYRQWYLAGMAEETKKLVESRILSAEEVADLIKDKEIQLSQLDFPGRVRELTNNFFQWFPGGYRRKLLGARKTPGEIDADKAAEKERLIRDLDAAIGEGGYVRAAEAIGSKGAIDEETRLKIMADAYLRMREKGYDGVILRQ